jgi:Holliday junction resolvase-like predicted endonuclease
MRTRQQRTGDAAEDLVADRLQAAGWQVLAQRLRLGRDEVDILAVDPGPPRSLVIVEVRFRGARDYGLPEETFDWRKRARLKRAFASLLERGLPGGRPVEGLPVRLDLVVVEPGGTGVERRIRHYRNALAG